MPRLVIKCSKCECVVSVSDFNIEKKMCADCHLKNTQKYYTLERGYVSRSFFEKRLVHYMSKNTVSKMNKYWSCEDEPIEYLSFGIENESDNVVEYSECLLLEYINGFIPVIVTGINTSSYYALERCYMLCDEQDDETYTFSDICEKVSDEYKQGFMRALGGKFGR